jgi:hypothetical protein
LWPINDCYFQKNCMNCFLFSLLRTTIQCNFYALKHFRKVDSIGRTLLFIGNIIQKNEKSGMAKKKKKSMSAAHLSFLLLRLLFQTSYFYFLFFILLYRKHFFHIPDLLVNKCANCKRVFSSTLRKHHCRLCGFFHSFHSPLFLLPYYLSLIVFLR